METRVLILDGAGNRELYRPSEHWAKHFDGAAYDAAHMPSGEPAPSLDRYTHLILTGSEASIIEPVPWFDRMARTIREAAERGLSILGSCFGHQMLVYALSGSKHVRRAPKPEIGWVAIEILADDPLFVDTPRPWHTLASHFDEVVDPPPPWRVLAKNETCAVQALRYGDRPIWGIQPHPEIEPEEAKRLFRHAIDWLPERADIFRAALAQPVRDDGAIGGIVKQFLESGARWELALRPEDPPAGAPGL